ncbi:MAG: dolichol-P-glucose synthetase [Archaeoglobales archaeon]|nr:MAG: dolichol-P-glucose synthetase [Archaeoglobales archaeon]
MKVSVILPTYNEAERIENTVNVVKRYLDDLGYDYEIIIAEDGSTDGTDEIARRLSENDSRIVHIHSDERLGRGKALTNAIKHAKGEIVAYIDVDLSTDIKHLKELFNSILEGYDVATGSRLIEGSETERPLKRDLASKVYNFLVRILLGSKLRDHQCGFKAFRRSSILPLLDKVRDNHWFWDTEILVLAQKEGLKVREFPVRWKQSEHTKVKLTKDVIYMFSQIVRMWMEQEKSKKFLISSIAISVFILVSLAYFSGFGLKDLMMVNPNLIVVSCLLYSSTFLIRGLRFEYILNKIGFKTSSIFSSEGVAISQMVNVVTPARIGDVVRAYVFKLREIPISSCISGLAVERIFDLFAVISLSLISICVLGGKTYLKTVLYATLIMFLILATIFMLSRMKNIIGKMSSEVKTALNRGFPVLILLSLLNWMMDVVTCYIISLPFNVNMFVVMLGVSIANIVKAFPITPGGIGTYEVAMTGTFVAFGLNPSNSFTIALIDHAIKNTVTLVVGYLSLAHLNVRMRDLT